ncbi:hypothetical protein Ocin01_07470 [Orchesella cincta]|uniref:Uncharacterized protein n=1 Tax=Orchesella cincta TaxID=48709 RepID=A0A1D2N1R2_ORCCI|nr:hypothetical protein Ocin01_07470 [Orchesella cincta]
MNTLSYRSLGNIPFGHTSTEALKEAQQGCCGIGATVTGEGEGEQGAESRTFHHREAGTSSLPALPVTEDLIHLSGEAA